jgi:hypothetical protein
VLAGGPLELESVIENRGDAAAKVPTGSDRSRQRPSQVSFTGTIEESGRELTDPWAALPDRGGVGGHVEVAPGASLRQVILVNDFLSLDDLREVTAPGETGTLLLRCTRLFSIDRDAELRQTADLDLRIPIVRDDDRLASLATGLNERLQTDAPPDIATRERLIAQLASVATPGATKYLQTLSAHPDPHLAALARAALQRRELRAGL